MFLEVFVLALDLTVLFCHSHCIVLHGRVIADVLLFVD